MRKTMISSVCADNRADHQWLDMEQTARVEVTSEAAAFPVEGALLQQSQGGWRADSRGVQTIRLLFDHAQTIQLIRLVFKEQDVARTQEFVLRWLQEAGPWRDVVRQQWNFSPPTTVYECEEYNVNLREAGGLELTICPDISRGQSHASLESLRVSASFSDPTRHRTSGTT